MSDDKNDVEILCPHCDYRPVAEDRWSCMPSCGTSFHTFWTRALCPGCGWRWAQTQCPHCGELSQHEHWYRPKKGATTDTKTHEPIATP
jgi:anaerobic ribonucleoside-triphosphate reductase